MYNLYESAHQATLNSFLKSYFYKLLKTAQESYREDTCALFTESRRPIQKIQRIWKSIS